MKAKERTSILLVEDNPNDAELTLRALSDNNIANDITLVEDGEAALDYVFCRGRFQSEDECDPPKLIILDLKLPKIDGLEVLKQIKSNEKTRTIPVVVLTSSKHETDLVNSYKLGVNSYIVKPVEFEKFLAAVKQLGMYWLLINQQP